MVDVWFTGSTEAAAILVCKRCPVRAECLEDGLWEEHGVWGGLTRDERLPYREGRPVPAGLTVCENCRSVFPTYKNQRFCCPECRTTAGRKAAQLTLDLWKAGVAS